MSELKPASGMTVVASGNENGIDWCTCAAPIYGAVNGYVRIPKDHPWSGLGYDDIDVDAPGGLTYSNAEWIGFDTLHYRDFWPDQPSWQAVDATHWTPEMVADETRALARRVAEVSS